MIVSSRQVVFTALLVLGALLPLTSIIPVSTYTAVAPLATRWSTGWHNSNSTGRQQTWQRTSRSTTWQHNTWTHASAIFTRSITFTHSSKTVTLTFTHSPHVFSKLQKVTTTTLMQAQCGPNIPGCPGYVPPSCSPCYSSCPGYPYYCYQNLPLTTITETAIPTYVPVSSLTGATTMTPAIGAMVHDIWLIVVPLQGGEFAFVLNGQGLQQNGSYLIEGVTKTQMTLEPITISAADAEFVADANGNGVYWHVLSSDSRLTYGQILLLYLPNRQMQDSQLVASANLD